MRALVVGVLAAVLLAGCGEDADRSTYCDALRGKQATFGDMANSTDPAVLIKSLPTLEALGKQAPDDLADEWQVFLNALRDLRKTLEHADVQVGEFGPGKVPSDLSAADAKAIKDAADQLGSEEVVAAANGIETQARDVCHLQLGL